VAAWLDPLTRRWWRTVGRPVELAGEQAWLDAPMSEAAPVRDGWMAAFAARIGGSVRADVPDAGLLADLSALDGPGFAAAALHPAVRDFYQHTAAWRMEVWTGWTPAFRPFGELVSRLFGRRVEQLALPTRPLDVARGMDSRVSVIADGTGTQIAAGWLRTLRATGVTVYSGCYTSRLAYAARAPIHETFHVFVDDEGVLRTDHVLRLWSATAVRLHYKLDRPGRTMQVRSGAAKPNRS
jgi:hypothetical protein